MIEELLRVLVFIEIDVRKRVTVTSEKLPYAKRIGGVSRAQNDNVADAL